MSIGSVQSYPKLTVAKLTLFSDYQAFRLSEIERLADSVEEALGTEFVDQLFSWEEVRDQTRSAGV